MSQRTNPADNDDHHLSRASYLANSDHGLILMLGANSDRGLLLMIGAFSDHGLLFLIYPT